MEANARGYFPANLTVRAGVPVRWEITDTGTSGCTNAIISRALFTGQIDLTPGQTSVKDFTVSQPGNYRFSCWMGMVTGTIQAVDENGNAPPADLSSTDNQKVGGCGCGGN
ncbi:MAG: Heavy metal transport/detoxification protein [Candidatus Shapirobacteria bacterium GW2011_GWE1_38_92]|nr:MAG: Heavy metal transport/detoxification protein [Candidatus Shapirobacteria bacterium GW2011_GWE1_38_92]